VVNIEGDPDHPVNQGTLCSKGQALAQINLDVGKKRLTKPLYRAPGSLEWEEKSWEWTIEEIARRIKATRDKYFMVQDDEGRTVNRLEAIASLGGAALDNEECSLIVKAMRHARPGSGLHRAPGAYMTLLYCCGSGRVVR
jgi:formate dehydrogenase major subunit